MKFNSLIPELTVKDLERTKTFYTDVLGFTVEYEREEDRFVFLSLEGNQLMFEQENGNWNTGVLEASILKCVFPMCMACMKLS